MTYYQAALHVLRSAGQPLTTREITESAIAEGLIGSAGKTPVNSMARVLYLRVQDDPDLVKIMNPGSSRAKPGPVRWKLRRTATANRPPEA